MIVLTQVYKGVSKYGHVRQPCQEIIIVCVYVLQSYWFGFVCLS